MSQISKYPISKDVEKRTLDILKDTIAHLNNPHDIDEFLDDFLSPIEKIMLSKRLAIAILLAKDYSYPSICNVLRVTPATVATVSLKFKYSGRGYKKAVERILRNEKQDEFWQKVEDILSNIPKAKGSNWSYQKKKYEEQKRKKKRPF